MGSMALVLKWGSKGLLEILGRDRARPLHLGNDLNNGWRVDEAQGLQDFLDVLKDSSRQLKVSLIPEVPQTKPVQKIAGGGELVMQRSRD